MSREEDLTLEKFQTCVTIDVDKTPSNLTALLNAAAGDGRLEHVKWMVEVAGADINHGNHDERRPLHFACKGGHIEVVRYLLDKGAHPTVVDCYGDTPLGHAILYIHEEIEELLRKAGARTVKPSESLTMQLIAAAGNGNIAEAERLIFREGVDPNTGDYDQRTALHLAASEGQMDMVLFLLDNGAKPNAQDRWGGTPLGDAVLAGHEAVAAILRQKGANFNTKELSGIRAELCAAASAGRLNEVMRLVEEGGADVSLGDYDRRTPLHLAASEGHADVVKFLLDHSANPNAEDRWGGTPYSDAVRNCHSACATLIQEAGGGMGTVGSDSHWRVDPKSIKYLDEIAQGFQGSIWRAQWRSLTVIVKRLKTVDKGDGSIDPVIWKLFSNEIDLLSRLRHPNLVMFLGACVDASQPLVLVEYCRGGSLQTLLDKQRRLSLGKALRYAHDIALGLNYLHTYNPVIIHRDLCPSNILLTPNGSAKIADFGFSKLTPPPPTEGGFNLQSDRYTMTGGLGSLRYMAPEVLRHQQYNEAVDVYSYAMVLYYMLTGTPPFYFMHPMDAARAVANDKLRPTIPESLPSQVKDLLERCWHDSPSSRPRIEDVLAILENHISKQDRACTIS